jgi:hypothetical protein
MDGNELSFDFGCMSVAPVNLVFMVRLETTCFAYMQRSGLMACRSFARYPI